MASLKEVMMQWGVDNDVIQKANNLKSPLEKYLLEASGEFIKMMQDKIDEGRYNANGQLRQSLLPPEEVLSSGDINIEFTSSVNYALWRNDGVSGTQQMRETEYQFKSTHPSEDMIYDIEDWMTAKGYDAEYSWGTAVMILRFGFDGARFIEAAFSEDNLVELEDNILTITGNTVTAMFSKVIPEFK